MKDSYLLSQIQEAIKSLVGEGYFSCLDMKAGFWQIARDNALKQYIAFTMGNIGFFKCECMSFGLSDTPAMFQRLMQNWLGKLNMTYCLIYLDDVIVFSKTEEEHLHCLCVVFKHFREHHLKLRLTKCEFFKSKINYLAHHVSKEGIQPSKENLKTVAEIAPCILQPLHEHLSGEGASKKNEWLMLTENALGAFNTLKKACLKAPILAFTDFNKPFLLETYASKLGLGAVLSQKQTYGQYHLVA